MRAICLLLWLGAFCGAVAVETPGKPNVLFIAIDDLNDWLGCMGGHPQAITPNIDALAARGVLFMNAHCSAPACKPSRSSLFTGKQPFENGIYSNWGKQPAVEKDATLPKYFEKHGYRTAGTGKMLHGRSKGYFQDDFFPEQRWSPLRKAEVQYTAAELPSKGTNSPRQRVDRKINDEAVVLPLNGLRSERNPRKADGESFDWGPFAVADSAFGDGQITDWAMAKLAEPRFKPLFLGVGYYRPHIPLWAPKRDFDAYPPVGQIQLPAYLEDDLADLSPVAKQWALEPVTAGSHKLVAEADQWREAVRAYLACVTFVDRQVGRLLDALARTEHAESTWIVLWSDHGWHLGEKDHWGKWTGWRQSTRVPLLIVPPGNRNSFERGTKCWEPVSLLDLYPTLVDACGLPPNAALSGQSLLPLLRTRQKETGRVVVTTFDKGNFALSGKGWRYIRYKSGEEELYDVGKDPHEWRNLIHNPEVGPVLARFRKEVEKLP